MDSIYDVVIIGTGLYGIQAARYYLDIHPDAKLLLLEADDVVGGTWSSKRIYPEFWTQTPVKMAEFSDRPMTPPPPEDQFYGFFPGKYTTTYLESYVDSHVYADQSIRDRIMFNTYVDNIARYEETKEAEPNQVQVPQWTVTYNTHQMLHTSKLIDASGLTSQPQIPSLPGSSNFKGRILHHKSFGQQHQILLEDPTIQNICVLGGAKSAADVVYACAKAPAKKKSIHWIIREDGNGPAAFFSAQPVSGRYANSNEGFYNRFLASFLPNAFGNRWGPVKWLLQGTWPGRWYVKRLWDGFDKGLRALMNYHRDDGKEQGFANLEPDTPIFWQNDSSGVHNHSDFFDIIAKNVQIHRQNVSNLEEDTIVLEPHSGSVDEKLKNLPCDALVFCTGWSASTTFFSPEQASILGLSVPMENADPESQAYWYDLEKVADPVILSRFPVLRHPPNYRRFEPKETPFRLYKAMVPPIDVHDTGSLVFLGKMVVGNNFRTAEAQALWAVAYLDGQIPNLPSRAQVDREVAETVAWDRRRYLNKGELGSWFYFDVVDYADALLEHVGLQSHRQGKGWLGDLMDPCFASDLRGLKDEYRQKIEP